MSAVLPKPQLRGGYSKRVKIHLFGATLFSSIGALLFKIYYVDRRKRLNREFPKHYDAEKHFQVMVEHDLLQSVLMIKAAQGK